MVRKSYLEGFRTGKTKPELRGKEPFVQVSWDVALGLTAKAILDTIEKHGNEGCFSSSYGGWSHAGIFRPNVLQRMGSYPPPRGASPWLGLEVSGVVAAVGQGVPEWKKGYAQNRWRTRKSP